MGISREDILFHLLKNKVVPSGEEMRKKYETHIDVTSLRTRIINYQIEKYGNQLDTNIDRQDMKKATINAKHRREYRRNGKRKRKRALNQMMNILLF